MFVVRWKLKQNQPPPMAHLCPPSSFQFTAFLASFWDKFGAWSHFRSPVAPERRSFHFPTCAFLPALGCLSPPHALHQLGAASKLAYHRSTEGVRWEGLKWEGASGGHLPNICFGRDTQTGVLSPTFMHILEMSKNGDSTASLHLLPMLHHPHRRKMFADAQSEPPVFHSVPTASCSGTRWR